jgi:hypothetical protein
MQRFREDAMGLIGAIVFHPESSFPNSLGLGTELN